MASFPTFSKEGTMMSQQATSCRRTAVGRRRQSLIAGALGVVLTGISVVAEAQVLQQAATSVQQTSREQADRILNMNYKEFAELRQSATRPKGYRWDTDGCTPDWAPKYFTRACYLHDFGYRNYGSARKDAPHLSPTQQTKDWIDKRFYQEMVNICNDEAHTDQGRATCKKKAAALYNHLKKGRKAFFGPYTP
jgi:Prokaryotic phospholipase A2